MIWLLLGLVAFIGVHLTRVIAEDWRTRTVQRIGKQKYQAIYSIISIAGFAAIVWGYALSRGQSAIVWSVAPSLFPVTAILMLLSMIALAGFHVKRSHISVKLRHPMIWSVILLCIAHLIVNGRVVDILLFGSLLLWSIADLISCYARDSRYGVAYPVPETKATLLNIGMGFLFFFVFAFLLHRLLIGVPAIPTG